MTAENPFKYFKTSPKIIRLAVLYYVRYPLSFRQVEDILHERGTLRRVRLCLTTPLLDLHDRCALKWVRLCLTIPFEQHCSIQLNTQPLQLSLFLHCCVHSGHDKLSLQAN